MQKLNIKIKEARELLELTQLEAAKKSGLSQRDVSQLENGKKEFIPTNYIQFLNKNGIDINSLFNNDIPISKHKNVSLNVSESVSLNQKHDDVNTLHEPTEKYTKVEQLTRQNLRILTVTVDKAGNETIPLVPVKAYAGYLNNYDSAAYFTKLPCYNLPGYNNATYRMFEVEGQSMYNTLHQGDIVIGEYTESFHDIRDNHVYVVITEREGILVKRIFNRIKESNKLILSSDNKITAQFPNIVIEPEDIRELWHIKGLMSRYLYQKVDTNDRLNSLEARFAMLEQQINHNSGAKL